jgi:hypothetical protein
MIAEKLKSHNIFTRKRKCFFRGGIMPKVGGRNIDQCMSMCMEDLVTKEEYPDVDERQRICYAACIDRFMETENYNLALITVRDGKYIFTGEFEGENPTLRLIKGESYVFEVRTAGHPFWIKTVDSTGVENAYSQGVSNNGLQEGRLMFRVPDNAPGQLFYNCQFHDTMKGNIQIVEPDIEDLLLKYREATKK